MKIRNRKTKNAKFANRVQDDVGESFIKKWEVLRSGKTFAYLRVTGNTMNLLTTIASVIILGCNSSDNTNDRVNDNRIDTIEMTSNDTLKRPFQIVFKDLSEIRMGSPYNAGKVEIIGTDKIQLPEASWQDKYAWSDDSKKLVLVKWESSGALPVFRLFIIDTETGATQESIRMLGAINKLKIIDKTIYYNKFYLDKAKSKDTLCCNVDETYVIPN